MADVEKETKETDLNPVPTQEQLDDLAGGKDRKKDKRETKAVEELVPTPTQAEADKHKAALFGVADKDAKADVKSEPPEELPPTPTQFEIDLHKTAAMSGGKVPEGGGDPQRASAEKRKTVEAARPSGQYATRQATPAKG